MSCDKPYIPNTVRHRNNVTGDFYSNGECTACGAPESEAPDLLSDLTGDNWETWFVKQPETPDEIERACRAIVVCCADALRYGGNEPAIIQRLGNRVGTCDHLLPGGPVRRPDESDHSWSSLQVRLARDGQTQ